MASCRAGAGVDGGSRQHRQGGLGFDGSAGRANVAPRVGRLEARRRIRAQRCTRGVHRPIRGGVECRCARGCGRCGAVRARLRRRRCLATQLDTDRPSRPAPNGRFQGVTDAGGRRRPGAPWRHHHRSRNAGRTMTASRPSACSMPPAASIGRHARMVAVSLAGALAGLAAGMAGGAGGSPAGRGGVSFPASMATSGPPGVRQPGLASSGVAMVLAPASEAAVQRRGRQDGQEGPP